MFFPLRYAAVRGADRWVTVFSVVTASHKFVVPYLFVPLRYAAVRCADRWVTVWIHVHMYRERREFSEILAISIRLKSYQKGEPNSHHPA